MECKFLVYRFLRAVGSPVIRFIFRPEIVGAENIPKSGRVIIAGNHKHALDPILIDISTKRIVRTLAKKELHERLRSYRSFIPTTISKTFTAGYKTEQADTS